MDGDSWLQVFILTLCVIGAAYFACAESAFSSMNRIKMKSRAEDGDRRAKNAMYITNNFERAITTMLIGINVTHIATASIATVLAEQYVPNLSSVYVTLITTVVVFLFCEMIPKALAMDRPQSLSLAFSGSMRFFMKLLYPIVAFFTWISSFVTRLFQGDEQQPSITEDDLYDIIDVIEEEGVMDEEQSDIMKSVLSFSDTCAGDVMTVRDDIIGLEVNLSCDELLKQIHNSPHSRMPVYEGDLDHIIGVVHVRRFIKRYFAGETCSLRECVHPVKYSRRTEKIVSLLTDMRQNKAYLAIIIDDDGKTLGLCTIEDFLEELVGEIWDEGDVVDESFIKLGGNRFRINGDLTVGEVCSRIGYVPQDITSFSKRFNTFVLTRLGHMPDDGESFRFERLEITVETTEENHIIELLVRLLSEEELSERLASEAEASEKEAE